MDIRTSELVPAPPVRELLSIGPGVEASSRWSGELRVLGGIIHRFASWKKTEVNYLVEQVEEELADFRRIYEKDRDHKKPTNSHLPKNPLPGRTVVETANHRHKAHQRVSIAPPRNHPSRSRMSGSIRGRQQHPGRRCRRRGWPTFF